MLLLRILETAAVAGAICGSCYYLLCILSATRFLRHSRQLHAGGELAPPVSILKPLRGTDPDIYEAFRSHCLQDYPEYEIIFGVSDPKDPAIELVKRLQGEFPNRRIELVYCQKVLGANLKVSNLVQMLPSARYDVLLVNDSDIKVPPDYLRRVAPQLCRPNVGMVTCLYRGIAGDTLGSKLESLGISTDFGAGVLAARQLEGIRFGLGSTLAFTRSALEKIGGFEPIVDYLADDYELGARIAESGLQVLLSDVVVDHHLPDYTTRAFIDHQLRWNRSTRHSRRWGYTGMVLTFGLPWALLALVLSWGAPWAWGLLALASALRLAMALFVGARVIHDSQLKRTLWLLPLRDMAAMALWVASYTGRRVAWRGDWFVLENGKLRPA